MSSTVVREAKRLVGSARYRAQSEGVRALVSDVADFVAAYATYPLARRRFAGEAFEMGGARIPYVRHHYNRAWRNERSVELALAEDFFSWRTSGRLLEVGNVMAHYGVTGHDVLDKYERSPGVLNDDIVDFEPADPYDAVLSISTLEHVGWDETPKDETKTLRAYQQLRKVLAPGGSMLLTTPFGQNPYLDRYLAEEALDFPEIHYLKRLNRRNEWAEVELRDVVGTKYGSPYRNGNALFVGIVRPET